MKSNKKIIKIVSELINFNFNAGVNDINIDIKYANNEFAISIKGRTKEIIQKKVDNLRRMLNTPRDLQIEEYYWELIGETQNTEELSLVGMMIDKSEVYYKDGFIEIRIYRKE